MRLLVTLQRLRRDAVAALLLGAALAPAADGAAAIALKSPDGAFAVAVDVKEPGGVPVYRIDWKGRPLILDSRLGLDIEGASLTGGLAVAAQAKRSADSTWKPVCGEREVIRDRYNEVVVDLKETAAPGRRLQITFRAYDEGVAFCQTLPKQAGPDTVKIAREPVEFRLAADWPAWATYSGQGVYEKVPVSAIKTGCERPLVVEMGAEAGPCAALGEAKLVDYARMKFEPLKGVSHALVAKLDGPVEARLPLTTPWRVVMAADSPGRLLENNFIFLNLNDPCAIADTSWIRPGKVIREVTLTTQGGKACVDFAVKRGLQFIEYDAGWYGHEYDDASDATTVTVDPKRSKGPLDLQEVIRYGKERGVGVIVYVNRRALERQLDQILPLYREWGIDGIKYGFVNVGSQQWTSWLHDAIRKAGAQRFMLDVHDEYRMTGYSRTWPNLMTVEGVHGDECSPSNRITLAYAFTRYLAGPADNTVCYYDGRVDRLATHAYQLAKPVCLFSPWQFLFWYDRPPASPVKEGGAGGSSPQIGDDPELEFWNHMPTVWDETKVLHGAIGEYAVIARRRGAEWFIGAMNADTPRDFDIPLSFLGAGAAGTAHVYSDDPSMATRTRVRIDRKPVTAATTLKIHLPARGGQAIRIAPTDRK